VHRKAKKDIPIELLWDVLSCNPSMHAAVEAVDLIEQECNYPIVALADIEQVFGRAADDRGVVRVGRCAVSRPQLEGGLPSVVFPIEDREQLISALLCAFESSQLGLVEQAISEQRALARIGRLMEKPNG